MCLTINGVGTRQCSSCRIIAHVLIGSFNGLSFEAKYTEDFEPSRSLSMCFHFAINMCMSITHHSTHTDDKSQMCFKTLASVLFCNA